MTKRPLLFVGIALALPGVALPGLVLPALAETPGVPLTGSLPHLTVTGMAEADVVPDQADLHLAVYQERRSAGEAANATAQAAGAVLAAMKGRGVEPGDIGTTFVLTETFDVRKDEHGQVVSKTPRGFEADEEISIRMRDVAKIGPIARDLISEGANTVRSIDFFYSKDKQKRAELATAAMRDALDRAKTYSGAIGLRLGRVLQIGEDPAQSGFSGAADLPSRRAPRFVDAGSKGVSIPTEPGRQHLSESVTVVWEIEGQAR